SCFIAQSASAVMLKDEVQGLKSMDFMSFYKDHADPNLYYYLPRSFRVVMDPVMREPLFSASFIGLKTPSLEDGFGQVNLTIEPYLDEELKDRALREVLAINANAH